MEINGPGFILREWKTGDEVSLQNHANNHNISKFLRDRFPFPYGMDDAIDWINLTGQQTPVINFAIVIDGQAAGGIGIELRDDIYRKTAILGYWLGEAYHGRGIVPEAVKLMVSYAFAAFDLLRIQAGVFGNNPRSMRVLEKAGFTKEAVLKNSVIKDGFVLDEHLYAVLST